MTKVCILSTVNIMHMTLVSLYTDYLEKNYIDYDIIYIDKYNIDENTNAKEKFPFREKKTNKFMTLFKFKKFAINIINNQKYDYIITWNELTAVIFADYLTKNFKDRYIVNIRDYFYNKNPYFALKLKKAIVNSVLNTISSDKFKIFLPDNDYLFIHSLNKSLLKSCEVKRLKTNNDVLTILFIGKVSYKENMVKLLGYLGNDKRYNIIFAGKGTEFIYKYVHDNKIENIKIINSFKHEETSKILKDADIIYNLYKKGKISEDTAISIKFYYALYMHIPILVFSETYMNDLSIEAGIGYTVNDFKSEKNFADNLFKWYYELDQSELDEKCNKILDKVYESHNQLEIKLNVLFKL